MEKIIISNLNDLNGVTWTYKNCDLQLEREVKYEYKFLHNRFL